MSAKDMANKAQLSARINGTGAFKFVEQKGDTTVLAGNAEFFLGAPKIPGVNTSSSATRRRACWRSCNGEADIIERLEQEQVDTISKDPRFDINKAVSVENKYLWFRCSKKPFDDPPVRLAGCHAIDRSRSSTCSAFPAGHSKAHISPVKFGYTEVADFPGIRSGQGPEAARRGRLPEGARACRN